MRTNVSIWILLPITLVGCSFLLLKWMGRRQENAALMKTGLCADAEIIASDISPIGDRIRFTKVTYRFLPDGNSEPIEVTKYLDGIVDIAVGRIVPIRYLPHYPTISIMVPYASKQDAS